jgi:phenylalanyl-tRNA synthetase beta chain
MKLPLSWLKEFIPVTQTPDEIAKLLTSVGIEVEGINAQKCLFSSVVTGLVVDTINHPDAEKLKIATVSDGSEEFQVVCGASNCRKGLVTAFAKIGATLFDREGKSFKIKKSKLRGVESYGMLCAEEELGLSVTQSGIIELPLDTPIGIDLETIFSDPIFDISLTPNLIHCSSVLGIARELSCLLNLSVQKPKISFKENLDAATDSFIEVQVEDNKLCPRYAARLIKGVKVAPSPKWLKDKLESAGLRSINNVVDATNYVLLEFGHPLHAFDFAKISLGKVMVRKAVDGEVLLTLDGQERKLKESMLVIADHAKPLAIAGVMGGQNSEVTLDTQDILLESAYFNPSSIRKTSKLLGLSTESSKHFERGADPNQVIESLNRVSALIQELAGGFIAKGIIDVKPHEFAKKTIVLRLDRINKLLGLSLSLSEVEVILNKLECKITHEGIEVLHVLVPTYRGDIDREIDLIEEVARIYGYNNIPKVNAHYQGSITPHAPAFVFERKVKEQLLREGLQELLTCDLISPSLSELLHNDKISKEAIISVLNPTSIEQSVLRISLLPGLLQVVKNNQAYLRHDLFGFEIGRVHFKHEGFFKEHTNAAIVLCGKSEPHFWSKAYEEVDFYTLKGHIENLLDGLYFEKPTFRPSSINTLHPGRQASIFIDDKMIGTMGEVHPCLLRELSITKRVLFAEIDLHDLYKAKRRPAKMKPLAVFPSISRDWTLPVKDEITIDTLFNFIGTLSSDLLQELTLQSIYKNDKILPGKKNVTLHFVYRDSNKTLSFEEVEKEHERITKATADFINQL